MSRMAGRDAYARRLRADDDDARVDLALDFVDDATGEVIWRVGGVWDRRRKRWTDDEPETTIVCRVHPGQVRAALWFREWLEAYLEDRDLAPPIYSCLFFGGTRAGKTRLALWLTVAFCITVPKARVWAVQEVLTAEATEIADDLAEVLPDEWFELKGRRYTCLNGTTITIRSASQAQKLKRGRCDFAFLNEAQNVDVKAYYRLRERTSDTSGLLLMAANPPNNNPAGEWVGDLADDCEGGRAPNEVTFPFRMEDNPHVNRAQLASMRARMSPREYAIEVEGKRMQPSDAVAHAWSNANLAPLPEIGDVTEQFLARCGLGGRATDFVGLDFQRSPGMAWARGRAYRNPSDERRPLLHYFEACVVEQGDEYDLSDALYAAGMTPESTVLIGDASGEWQDADRTKGGRSFEILRTCGWKRLWVPDRDRKDNPDIVQRVKNDNRLLATESGDHQVLIDPELAPELVEAVKGYRNGPNGVPNRRHKHAHLYDAWSYPLWRLYPPPVQTYGVGYKSLKRRKRRRQLNKIW